MSDLVKWSQAYGKAPSDPLVISDYSEELAMHAADRIEALEAENARLTDEIEHQRDLRNDQCKRKLDALTRAERAEAQLEAEQANADRLAETLINVKEDIGLTCGLSPCFLRMKRSGRFRHATQSNQFPQDKPASAE